MRREIRMRTMDRHIDARTSWHPYRRFGALSFEALVEHLIDQLGIDISRWEEDYDHLLREEIRREPFEIKLVAGIPSKDCPDCGGSGKYIGLAVVEKCGTCNGRGNMPMTRADWGVSMIGILSHDPPRCLQ